MVHDIKSCGTPRQVGWNAQSDDPHKVSMHLKGPVKFGALFLVGRVIMKIKVPIVTDWKFFLILGLIKLIYNRQRLSN